MYPTANPLMGAAYATSPSTFGWILGATVRNHDTPPDIVCAAAARGYITFQKSAYYMYGRSILLAAGSCKSVRDLTNTPRIIQFRISGLYAFSGSEVFD